MCRQANPGRGEATQGETGRRRALETRKGAARASSLEPRGRRFGSTAACATEPGVTVPGQPKSQQRTHGGPTRTRRSWAARGRTAAGTGPVLDRRRSVTAAARVARAPPRPDGRTAPSRAPPRRPLRRLLPVAHGCVPSWGSGRRWSAAASPSWRWWWWWCGGSAPPWSPRCCRPRWPTRDRRPAGVTTRRWWCWWCSCAPFPLVASRDSPPPRTWSLLGRRRAPTPPVARPLLRSRGAAAAAAAPHARHEQRPAPSSPAERRQRHSGEPAHAKGSQRHGLPAVPTSECASPLPSLALDAYSLPLARTHSTCIRPPAEMKCEGPEKAPCRRCRAAQVDCVFEAPPAAPPRPRGGGVTEAWVEGCVAVDPLGTTSRTSAHVRGCAQTTGPG